MADLAHNVGKGRGVQLAINVDTGSPANSRLIMSVWNSTDTDDAVRDADTVAALEALTNTVERTTGGWARKTLAAADVTITLDDTNNNHRVDVPDQTWTAVTTGASTDIGVSYDPDNTAGTDSDLIPITWHDFIITPDGSDVTAQIHADGILSAT